jgi:O-antigen ligase
LTRSVWIGSMLVGLCVGWIYLRRYMPALALLGLAILVLGATVAPQDNLLAMKRDKHLSAADALRSIQLRPVLAWVAWNMFQDSPLIGHGYGGYFHSSLPYLSSRSQDAALDAVRPYMQHNVLLSLLVDAGLLAAGLFVAAIGLMGLAGWKLAKNDQLAPEMRTLGIMMLGCLAGYLFNGMFHDVSVIPMANNVLLLIAGVTASAYAVQGQLTSLAPSPIASPIAVGSFEPRLALGRRTNDLPPTSLPTS